MSLVGNILKRPYISQNEYYMESSRLVDDRFCVDCNRKLTTMPSGQRLRCVRKHRLIQELRVLSSNDAKFMFTVHVPFNTQKEQARIEEALEPLGFKLAHKSW